MSPRFVVGWQRRLASCCCVWLLVTLGAPANARAEAEPGAPRVRFDWTSAAACEPSGDPDAELKLLLGDRYGSVPETVFRVHVRRAGENRYELLLHFVDAPTLGARTVELSSCEEVREAAVLLSAMALSPESSEPPQAPRDASAAAQERSAREPHHRFRFEVGALLDPWSLPGVSGGPALAASFRPGSWVFGLSGRYLIAREVDATTLPAGTRVRVDLMAGAVVAGFRSSAPQFRWGPQAELELGYLCGRAEGTEDGGNGGGALWSALWGGLALEVPIGKRVDLAGQALAGVLLRRPRFALEGESAFYTTAAGSLRLFLALNVALGPTE